MKTVEFPFEINWPWAIPFCLGNLATLVFWSIFVNCSASGSFHFFLSFSYEKKMWDKWVENLKHKIRWSIAETFSPRWRHFKIKMWAAKASGRNWERAVPEVPFTIHHGNFLRKGQLLFTNQFTVQHKMVVVCYQNCSHLLWGRIVLMIEKNFWNSRLKAENLK